MSLPIGAKASPRVTATNASAGGVLSKGCEPSVLLPIVVPWPGGVTGVDRESERRSLCEGELRGSDECGGTQCRAGRRTAAMHTSTANAAARRDMWPPPPIARHTVLSALSPRSHFASRPRAAHAPGAQAVPRGGARQPRCRVCGHAPQCGLHGARSLGR